MPATTGGHLDLFVFDAKANIAGTLATTFWNFYDQFGSHTMASTIGANAALELGAANIVASTTARLLFPSTSSSVFDEPRLPTTPPLAIHLAGGAFEGSGTFIISISANTFLGAAHAPLLEEFTSAPHPISRSALVTRIITALDAARSEDFAVGVESALARTLTTMIKDIGRPVVTTLEAILNTSRSDHETACEALRWLGAVEHSESRGLRRYLLERALNSASARRRYATVLGLGALDDPAALPALQALGERETNPRIRRTIQKVIEQLRAPRQ